MIEMDSLRERAKELSCLYRVHEAVSQRRLPPPQTFVNVLNVIPEGWQQPDATGARIEYLGRSYVGPGYASSGAIAKEVLRVGGVEVGEIAVSCAGVEILDEERALLRAIADRLGEYLEWKHTELLGERIASDATMHWHWRQMYVEALARHLPADRFGVVGLYLGGSTESGSAAHASDIDLLVHCIGSSSQRGELAAWLEGWSLCLAEMAMQQTGQAFDGGILNVQWLDHQPDPATRPDLRALKMGS